MLLHLQKYYLVHKGLIEARKICAIMKGDKYDKIAAELQDLLIRNWSEATKEAIRDVIRAVGNRAAFTDGDLNEMINLLKARLGTAFANSVAQDMLEMSASTYSTSMNDVIGISPTFNNTDNKALAALERYAIYPVLRHFDDHLEARARIFGKQIIEAGLNREEAGKLFEDEFAKKYNVKSFRYWQGYANHVVTRTREMGRVSAYERGGIEYAEVRAVLDHRTTEICRHMHGRRIKVKELVTVRDALMNNEDPEAVRDITPWPSAKQVSETKTKDLPQGAKMPPYHFNCRTRTVAAREVSDRNTVTSAKMGNAVAKESKKKLNSLTTQEYSNWMDTIARKRSFNYDEELLDRHMRRHAGKFGLTSDQRKEYKTLGRAIIRNSEQVFAKVHEKSNGTRQFQFVFFSEKGQVVVGDDLQLHGVFAHSNSNKAFENQVNKGKWLQLNNGN